MQSPWYMCLQGRPRTCSFSWKSSMHILHCRHESVQNRQTCLEYVLFSIIAKHCRVFMWVKWPTIKIRSTLYQQKFSSKTRQKEMADFPPPRNKASPLCYPIQSFAASCRRVDVAQTGGDRSRVITTAVQPQYMHRYQRTWRHPENWKYIAYTTDILVGWFVD